MAEVICDIKQKVIESAYAKAPFDEAKEVLEKMGYGIISSEETARLRIQEGIGSGDGVREAFIYDNKRGIFLTKNSPIMQNPREATQAHRRHIEYYLTDEQVEQVLRDSIKIPEGIKSIPTNRFGEDPITNYVFRNQADPYGQFLGEEGIRAIPIYLSCLQEKPFAKQMLFGGFNAQSSLDGDIWLLSNHVKLRGIKEDPIGY